VRSPPPTLHQLAAQQVELLLENRVVAFLPDVLENDVGIDSRDASVEEVRHRLGYEATFS
jgi:hypothetical protein